MFDSIFSELYWSSIINSASRLPKEAIIGVAASAALITMHKQHCDTKVKVAEAQARKAEADLEALKIKTFAAENPS